VVRGFSPTDSVMAGSVGRQIDIWALGVTLYCFIFGQLPFKARNESELFHQLAHPEYVVVRGGRRRVERRIVLTTKC
jgi:serine/threonine protein kinase